jgi:very-short-patch-repair endonuclease
MIKKICEICGREYKVRNYEKDKRRFCSKDCYNEYRKTEEYKRKRFTRMKELWQDPVYREKQIKQREKVWKDLEYRRKRSEIAKKLWQDPVYREKHSVIKKELWRDPEFREYMLKVLNDEELVKSKSEWAKRFWQNRDFREKVLSKLKTVWRSADYKKKKSVEARLRWQNPEYREKIIRSWAAAVHLRPNGLEKAFCDLLQSYFLNEWRYVGDGKIFIAGFVPDFVHREERWIIEVNGDYWHSSSDAIEKDKKKRGTYEKYGYKVLEVWENEFKSDPMGVVRKIMEYFYGGS